MKVKLVTITFLCVVISSVTVGYFLSVKKDGSLPIIQNQTHEKTSQNFHRSFFSQSYLFDESFKALEYISPKDTSITKGLVVNHHLLAPQFIARAFQTVATDKPITVVILSPNHFSVGKGQVLSSLYDWQTPYGIIESDTKIIWQLEKEGILKIEEAPFENEHGVSNIVAFAKKTIPNAKIIPIIIKDTSLPKESEKLADALKKHLPSDALVVASVDFSHYLPSNVADLHDAKSIAVMENFDYDGIKSLDVDSKPTLTTFLKYLEKVGAQTFTMLNHSNSAKIANDESILETTSYITGYFSEGAKTTNNHVAFLSFGDLMLDRYIRKSIDEKGQKFPFKKIERLLMGNDIVLANLEGSFTDFTPKPYAPNNLSFTFDPNLVPILKKLGFNLFNLANNHSLNFGKEGFSQSQKYLEKNSIDYFGEPYNGNNIYTIKNIRDSKIGFVGYHQLTNANFDSVITAIKEMKDQTDFIVAYTHWGAEYQTKFSSIQQQEARKIIDAGADVVIGSHPHIVQPIEIYNNKVIFYSLGNFLFDQTFSQKTQEGLGVGIVFDSSQIEYYLFPTEIKNLQILLPQKEKNDILLKELANNSQVPESFLPQIIKGKIIIKN